MKTITRYHAQKMLDALSTMALGHLDTDTLEAVIDNFDIIRGEVEKMNTLKAELGKRLYQGVEKDRLQGYAKAFKDNDTEKIGKDYADIARLREKEIEVVISLYNKVVELDIKEVDSKAFRKAVMKAQPETTQEAFDVLAPMFAIEEVAEDFSELDELIK